MKQSSIIANNKAEVFKPTHRAKILKCLEGKELNAKQISELSKLEYHSVMRRVGELERDGLIFIVKDLPVSVYKKTSQMMAGLKRADYELKQFRRWQKKALTFGRFMDSEIIEEITSFI